MDLSGLVDQAVEADQRVHQRNVEDGKVGKRVITAASSQHKPNDHERSKGKRSYSSMDDVKSPKLNSGSYPRKPSFDSEQKQRKLYGHCGYFSHSTEECRRKRSKPTSSGHSQPSNSMLSTMHSSSATSQSEKA